jgi:hypothetical protein
MFNYLTEEETTYSVSTYNHKYNDCTIYIIHECTNPRNAIFKINTNINKLKNIENFEDYKKNIIIEFQLNLACEIIQSKTKVPLFIHKKMINLINNI